MSDPSDYGHYLWCIKTDLAEEDGEIYAHADDIDISEAGVLSLISNNIPNGITFAPGQWKCVYIGDRLDGAPATVSKWRGEVVRI